jgi:hypothetical protein
VRFKIARIMRAFKSRVKVFLEISEKMLGQLRCRRLGPRGKALATCLLDAHTLYTSPRAISRQLAIGKTCKSCEVGRT